MVRLVVIALSCLGLVGAAGTGRAASPTDCADETATNVGTEGDDTLTGTPGIDGLAALIGQGGADVMDGREGPDYLSGAGGNDRFIGGPGNDLVYFDFSPRGIRGSLASGVATGWGRDTLRGIENLEGSSHSDVLVGNAD